MASQNEASILVSSAPMAALVLNPAPRGADFNTYEFADEQCRLMGNALAKFTEPLARQLAKASEGSTSESNGSARAGKQYQTS